MRCERCAGLVIEVKETLDTYETMIKRCLNCGWKLYPPYQPEPMRPVVVERRGRRKVGA